jgi:copper(I)-binding protein
MMLLRLLAAIVSVVLTSSAAQSQPSSLRVTDAWIRAAPPGAMVMAGYMTLENAGTEDVRMTAARSPQFGKIELHRTVIENEVAGMRKQAYFVVPAGGSLVLAPNARHLMMMLPNIPLQAGDEVTVVLTFDDATGLEVNAQVR